MLKRIWEFTSDIGCHKDLDPEEVRRLQLMNRLNLITFLALVFYMVLEIIICVYIFIPFLILMLVLVLITFLLLHKRKYFFAKNYATIIIAGCISFFVLATGEAFSEALFIPLAVMPLIVFRKRRSAVFYLFFLIALATALKIVQSSVTPLLMIEGPMLQFFRIMNLINGIAITFAITFYFKKANENYQNKLMHMNLLISEKNKEITDSINYARHIQHAILPDQGYFSKVFSESFILYKPKDIVAGDFYWLYESEGSDPAICIAAADCTGHGVPGAMVSVICSTALNSSVKEFGLLDPGKILDKSTELVIETFARSQQEVKDGMDISLCVLYPHSGRLLWSGANNPLWILRDGQLMEFKADKQPVGRSDHRKPFNTKEILLKKGDQIYLFTDGFADQFGGERGKKFKYSRFKELLIAGESESPLVQKNRIERELFSWQGDLEQVDDILVMGFRF
jgi:serine phosphatase RsbU (regulator of sigma subunit)